MIQKKIRVVLEIRTKELSSLHVRTSTILLLLLLFFAIKGPVVICIVRTNAFSPVHKTGFFYF